MEIKRIQLRGISRTPSDRLTKDGGVAESLNLYLEEGESAPVLKPKDKTEILHIPDTSGIEKVFIHKTQSREVYILADSQSVGYYEEQDGESVYVNIFNMNGESAVDIVSVGNTLIVSTSEHVHYALYINGEYKYLGTKIPEPFIEFYTTPTGVAESLGEEIADGDEIDDDTWRFEQEAWDEALADIREGKTSNATDQVISIQNQLWGLLAKLTRSVKGRGLFCAPLFARYAVRLYDGSYIYQSTPILLGAGASEYYGLKGYHSITAGSTYLSASIPYPFGAYATFRKWDIEGWEDIIESLDIFLSTDVNFPLINSDIISMTPEEGDSLDTYAYFTFDSQNTSLEDQLLSKSNFYKIASFRRDELSEIEGGYNLSKGHNVVTQDGLVTNERLPDYDQADMQVIPDKLETYNNSVLAIGGYRILPTGHPFIQSPSTIGGTYDQSVIMRYSIPSPDGSVKKVYSRNYNGDYTIHSTLGTMRGMLFYPNPKCNKVEIFMNGDVRHIAMKPHPFLNYAYAYWGIDKEYDDLPSQDVSMDEEEFIIEEDRKEMVDNKIHLSALNNPFYFPNNRAFTFDSNILATAVATAALSQGQFGQFPLYVFTEDGIWAMETASDGSFTSSKPMQREVCINPDSITPIDNAVLFMTNKGLMHIQGSQISNLSEHMNGRHYAIEESAKIIIDTQEGYEGFIDILADSTPFMTFMKNASIGYDYPGRRIICFNENESYQYVYKFDTQSWHKVYHSDYKKIIYPLNSYPRCEAFAITEKGYMRIIDLSTDRTNSLMPEKGIVATRPFDLDEPDVFKTITDARIRGQYAKGAVKFILLGSNDGINFRTISTLRGKSWKLFRIIILADLDAIERISWIDIQYETRFTNRLR